MPLYSPSWDEGPRCDTIRLAEMTQAEKAHMQALEFYAGRDPGERPASGIKEVTHYLQIPWSTTQRGQIEAVFYAGDDGGILCAIKGSGDEKTAVVVSLTHLRIAGNHPIAPDIRAYQLARTQKLAWGQ